MATKKATKEIKKKTTKKEALVEEVVEEIKDLGEKVIEKIEDVTREVLEEAKELVSGKKKKKPEKKKTKLEELKEKAKILAKGVGEEKKIDLKRKVSPEEAKDTLIIIEDYLKASVHLGTRVITPDMKYYVYKRRADGLAVFNTALLDDKIREGVEYLSKFAPEDVILVCKREAGWKAAELFSKITGIKTFTKKYPAGILTNPILDEFIETELVLICDPWLDKNALNDSINIKIPVLSICDTNNYTQGITKIIPGNNKSAKSLGMIFYLLAKLYTEKRKIDVKIPEISEWIDDWENLIPPK